MLQWINTTLVSPFSSLVILFLVLPSNFLVSSVEILNKILFFISFMYILIVGLSVSVSNSQDNLEYLIQNMIHQVIQIVHSLLAQIF